MREKLSREASMRYEKHEQGRIMACPAVRLSVEVARPLEIRRVAGKPLLVQGRPRCSDEEDCEFLEGPTCLLPMLREASPATPEA